MQYDNTFKFNDKVYSNTNVTLLDIINKLLYIINELNNKTNHSIIIQQIKDIIMILNKVIIDNNNNMYSIQNYYNKKLSELTEIQINISKNITKNETKIFDNGKYIGVIKNGMRDGKGIYENLKLGNNVYKVQKEIELVNPNEKDSVIQENDIDNVFNEIVKYE